MPTWCGRLRIRTKWVPESYLPNIISYSWMKPFASMASVAGRLWAGFMTCSYCGGHSKQTVDTTRVGRTFEVALDQDLVPFTLQQTCIRCMFSLHGATIETGEHLNTFKLQVFLSRKKTTTENWTNSNTFWMHICLEKCPSVSHLTAKYFWIVGTNTYLCIWHTNHRRRRNKSRRSNTGVSRIVRCCTGSRAYRMYNLTN